MHREREPETVADVLADMCELYDVDPNQHISTLMRECADVMVEDDPEDEDDDDDPDYEDDDDD